MSSAGLSVAVNAAPFVPGQSSDGSEAPAPSGTNPKAASFVPTAVNARPFVPGQGGSLPDAVSAAPFAPGFVTAAVNAPEFVPGFAAGATANVNAPEFVPGSIRTNVVNAPEFVPGAATSANVNAPEFVPGGSANAEEFSPQAGAEGEFAEEEEEPGELPGKGTPGLSLPDDDLGLGMTAHSPGSPSLMVRSRVSPFAKLSIQGSPFTDPGGMYYDPGYGQLPQHAFTRIMPTSGRPPVSSRFLPEDLRVELQQRSYLEMMQAAPETAGDLPDMIQKYHTVVPLEDPDSEEPSAALGVQTIVMKATKSETGLVVALRRVETATAQSLAAANEAVKKWGALGGHPGVAHLHDAFISRDVDDTPGLFLAYEYYPGAMTLEAAHLAAGAGAGAAAAQVPEQVLWSYAVQLVGALKAIHAASLFCGAAVLHPSKVLLVSASRVAIGSGGMGPVVARSPSTAPATAAERAADLAALGHLLLAVGCAAAARPSLETFQEKYPAELTKLVRSLVEAREGGAVSQVADVAPLVAGAALEECSHLASYAEGMQRELSHELENGRLLRLMVKLGMINERPEMERDPQWAETGDRYLLKLFRDWVFHQQTDSGAPNTDWGFVLEALNKLDAGVPEKILLMSRDEMSLLAVSYHDLKRIVESTYEELVSKSEQP